jgi:outer membrane murein-binding lipoprotein Lpp
MNYFRINLNKLEDKELALRKKRAEMGLYLGLAFLILGLLLAALTINARLSAKENEFKHTVMDLNAQIQALQKDENFVSEKEVFALDRLNSARVFWTRKVEALAALTGNKIALTEIKYERSILSMKGVARVSRTNNNFDLVSDFIERIKAEPAFSRDFRKIDFRSSSRVDFMDQDLLNFEIIMQ